MSRAGAPAAVRGARHLSTVSLTTQRRPSLTPCCRPHARPHLDHLATDAVAAAGAGAGAAVFDLTLDNSLSHPGMQPPGDVGDGADGAGLSRACAGLVGLTHHDKDLRSDCAQAGDDASSASASASASPPTAGKDTAAPEATLATVHPSLPDAYCTSSPAPTPARPRPPRPLYQDLNRALSSAGGACLLSLLRLISGHGPVIDHRQRERERGGGAHTNIRACFYGYGRVFMVCPTLHPCLRRRRAGPHPMCSAA